MIRSFVFQSHGPDSLPALPDNPSFGIRFVEIQHLVGLFVARARS